MSSTQSSVEKARLVVENVGGIDSAEVTLREGVNVLSGRNATNRTSLLQGIAAALGSRNVSLKSDADSGVARLEVDGGTYEQELTRTASGVETAGDPFLDDPGVADLFAFLFADNEARRAVVRGDDLRELIMRPVDTAAIRSEIDRLRTRKREIDDRLDDLDGLSDELPDLEERRRDLEARIEDKRSELADVRASIEEAEADPESDRAEKAELEDRMDALNEARSTLDDVTFRLETKRESLESLREERERLEAKLDDLPDPSGDRIGGIDAELERLRNRKRAVESTINRLGQIVQFNESALEDGGPDALAALADGTSDDDGGTVTDELVADDSEVVCWTCGSEVERSAVEGTLERLRELRAEKVSERNDLEEEIADLNAERDQLRSTRDEFETTKRRLRTVEDDAERAAETIDDLEGRREELEGRIDDLEAEVRELRQRDQSEVLELHREANELEYEIRRLESEREDVESEIESVEERLDDRADLEAEREAVDESLREQRTRIDRIEADAVETFNDHMESLLEVLGYTNIERIWIERTERETREGRRKVTRRTFDLHVVRTSEGGAAYEDTIDTLSESERETAGLVFALAGYLAHDLHETVPFMLLDSLEAIDSERIAALIDYFGEHADYLVVALLEEDAAAVDGDNRVTMG
jgi:predicted  nucleic acid-binding Zn-ribbon protein